MGIVRNAFKFIADDILNIDSGQQTQIKTPVIKNNKTQQISAGVSKLKNQQIKKRKKRNTTTKTSNYGISDDLLKVGLSRTIGVS